MIGGARNAAGNAVTPLADAQQRLRGVCALKPTFNNYLRSSCPNPRKHPSFNSVCLGRALKHRIDQSQDVFEAHCRCHQGILHGGTATVRN